MDIDSLQRFLANPNDDTTKLTSLQRQFASIWHANKCIKNNPDSHCDLPICPESRMVLNHYSRCNSGYKCEFQACGTARALIQHFNACTSSDCRFCSPLKNHSDKKSPRIVCTKIRHISSPEPSTSEFAASISKGFCSGKTWRESAYTARAAYFSTYSENFTDEDYTSSYRFMATSFTRRPLYGKTERIQRELIVMFHVQKCAELDHIDPTSKRGISCSVPHCPKMKRTLIHIAMCQGDDCKFPECDVTRTIIQHWLRCSKRRCGVCAPVLDSIPALDEGSDYIMDDKLMALLYTSTNGLTEISSLDLSTYEDDLCFEEDGVPQSTRVKRKVSHDEISSSTSSDDKRRRIN